MIGFNDRIGSIASFRPWADHFRPTPEKQTFSESVGMSQRCHFRTHAPQQFSACLSKDFDAKVENRTDASDLVRHIVVCEVEVACMKVEANNPTNANVGADGKRAFEMPLFELPKMAMPGVFLEIAEQSAVRVKENCEKMKAPSGEMADAFRETYSTNAKASADYGVKVIEISSVNTNSVFDFLTSLIGTKSVSEIIKLSAGQARKNFDVASAQNMKLWALAEKVAPETPEPVKKSVSRVLQKVI